MTNLERYNLVLECANYCIQYKWSLREIARNVGVSKSTVHRYLTDDLKYIDSQMYNECKHLLRSRNTKR